MKKWLKRLMWMLIAMLALVLVAACVSFLTNRNLPTHSRVVNKLSAIEKARLHEAFRLRRGVGDQVWPGWAASTIPIIVYNEEYAFLVGYQNPPAGWVKVPSRNARGGRWSPVAGDTFFGETYYAQRLEPGVTPQSFTVLVGDQWVATMQTREYSEIYLYSELRKSAPAFLRNVFPYRLIWRMLMSESDQYIAGLEHESFHSFEGANAGTRLEEAESAVRMAGRYPWNDASLNTMWESEMDLLAKAIRAASDGDARALARQFMEKRDARRNNSAITPELAEYERQREWLEGLAKYAEVSIGREVAANHDYRPCEELKDDVDFKNYSTRSRYWNRQLNEVTRLMGHSDEKRFYYSGMAEAILLDRLSPGWKQRIFAPAVFQEAMLREALGGTSR